MIDKFLESPFAGLAPWIVMAMLVGPDRFEVAVCAALGLSLLFTFLGHRRGTSFKLLELFDIAYFGTLAAIGLFASDALIDWLEKWSGEMTNIALVVFAFGSILIRNPFTLQYAREQVPKEYWETPAFYKTNRDITLVWALAFGISALAGLYADVVLDRPDEFWTAWIIPIGALLFAIAFTEWYPDVVGARRAAAAGDHSEPVPPWTKLIEFVPPFVVAVGIAMLVTDNDPDWLAIALIILGIVGGAALRKRSKAEAPSTTRAAVPRQ